MLLSLGWVILIGLLMASICQKIKLPKVIGILISGIALGPYALDLISPSILVISVELRQIALVIILIKAGLALNIYDLKKVGRPAILMSFLPACFEILTYLIFAPLIFKINYVEALLMGTVLAAVSPAIIVPRMIDLIEKKYGTEKGIPQLILAGASCDDVFVIVLFTAFSAMALGGKVRVADFLVIPASIVIGVLVGACIGVFLSVIFAYRCKNKKEIQNSVKAVIILSIAFILIAVEDLTTIPFSGLIAVVSMASVYKIKSANTVVNALSNNFSKLWIVAEILLFVLIGATVDISYLLNSSIQAILIIVIGLAIRVIGVLISLLGTKLNKKEKFFCVFAYLPKATVQAAIGAVPLSLGLPCGDIILLVAVLSILITAPLGAIAIDFSYKKLLVKSELQK